MIESDRQVSGETRNRTSCSAAGRCAVHQRWKPPRRYRSWLRWPGGSGFSHPRPGGAVPSNRRVRQRKSQKGASSRAERYGRETAYSRRSATPPARGFCWRHRRNHRRQQHSAKATAKCRVREQNWTISEIDIGLMLPQAQMENSRPPAWERADLTGFEACSSSWVAAKRNSASTYQQKRLRC